MTDIAHEGMTRDVSSRSQLVKPTERTITTDIWWVAERARADGDRDNGDHNFQNAKRHKQPVHDPATFTVLVEMIIMCVALKKRHTRG